MVIIYRMNRLVIHRYVCVAKYCGVSVFCMRILSGRGGFGVATHFYGFDIFTYQCFSLLSFQVNY